MAKKKLLTMAIALSVTLTALSMLPVVGCTCAKQPDQQAVLSVKDGDVHVMKAGADNWIEAQVSLILKQGDTMKVGDDSRAEITFFEGSTIELEAGTIISISELSVAADTGSTTISLNEEVGKTISRITKLSDQASSYEVTTPACAAVVRGSIMEVSVDQEGITEVINQEGSILTISQGSEVQIPEGMKSIVIPGQPPSLPTPVGSEGAGLIHITKSIMSGDGDAITYLYEVTNVGDTPQSNVYVLDDDVAVFTYMSGDTNGNNILDPGETWLYTGS
ncbi:FecR domain-containing protein [Chloroflexota bacterium]